MTETTKGYAAWHPEKGFDEYHYEGPIVFADHDRTLLDDIKELNENDRTNNRKGWRIVEVEVRRIVPLAWDSYANRSFEPVEKRAAEIYAALEYDGPGTKPEWTPGGNGTKQDEARGIARQEIRTAALAVTSHHLSGDAK